MHGFSRNKIYKSNDEEHAYMFRHLGHLLCASSPVAPQLQAGLWQEVVHQQAVQWWEEAVQPQVWAVQPQVWWQQGVQAVQPCVEWPQAGVVKAVQPWEKGASAEVAC